jgi:hypothetical protein
VWKVRRAELKAQGASITEETVYQDPALLARAGQLPVAATFPHPLLSQTNPTVCGPTSLANMLRSQGGTTSIDDTAKAAGCTLSLCPGGRTLDALAQAARTLGEGRVTVLRGLTLEQLRDELKHANDPARRYLVNFDRAPLFREGGGHHSPIGGYLEDADLVLVLDVNSHYGPWLVSTPRLFAAIDTLDSANDMKRGLLRLEAAR